MAPHVEANLAGPAGDELPALEDAKKVGPQDARELSKTFFGRMAVLEEGTPQYQYVRNTLIELNLSLVRFVASRFSSRGEEMEDIVQVGTIGLIKAIDRFDLSRGVEFTTFAIPCVLGEIRRYFRDTSWAVHVPRRMQERRIELAKAIEQLGQTLGRDPTAAELAAHLKVAENEVRQGIVASNGYTAGSLDIARDPDDEENGAFADVFGALDPALEGVENLTALRPVIAGLGQRDRRLLQMRFVQEMTQSQIGDALGVSQMHVSRLLNRLLTRLRSRLDAGDA
ncbi:SigB/SigF/SigG family RNA polymerase sigma factor [Actinacidiphila glaucinigra]|uniref:SigB/SigF/SigG family RNA polymerase sigma factor n=1 Tax=Actinacidiphila glaucinigra TaxID=235986 RepID=UPI0033A51E63